MPSPGIAQPCPEGRAARAPLQSPPAARVVARAMSHVLVPWLHGQQGVTQTPVHIQASFPKTARSGPRAGLTPPCPRSTPGCWTLGQIRSCQSAWPPWPDTARCCGGGRAGLASSSAVPGGGPSTGGAGAAPARRLRPQLRCPLQAPACRVHPVPRSPGVPCPSVSEVSSRSLARSRQRGPDEP